MYAMRPKGLLGTLINSLTFSFNCEVYGFIISFVMVLMKL